MGARKEKRLGASLLYVLQLAMFLLIASLTAIMVFNAFRYGFEKDAMATAFYATFFLSTFLLAISLLSSRRRRYVCAAIGCALPLWTYVETLLYNLRFIASGDANLTDWFFSPIFWVMTGATSCLLLTAALSARAATLTTRL